MKLTQVHFESLLKMQQHANLSWSMFDLSSADKTFGVSKGKSYTL